MLDGSDSGCSSKVEIYIHIRLHCGVFGRAVCCGVVWCGVVDDVVVFLFVCNTISASTRSQFELTRSVVGLRLCGLLCSQLVLEKQRDPVRFRKHTQTSASHIDSVMFYE